MPTILGIVDGSTEKNNRVEQEGGLFKVKKSLKLTYIVLSDDVFQTAEDIENTPGLPPLFYPSSGMFCRDIDPKEQQTVRNPMTGVMCILWHVDVAFDNEIDSQQNQSNIQNKRPVVSWGGDLVKTHLLKDPITGQAITTTALEPIECEDDQVMPILNIKRYEVFPWDPLRQLVYANKTNSTPFYGAPEGTVLMLPIEEEEDVIDDTTWAVVQYHLKFNLVEDPDNPGNLMKDSWNFKPVNRGYFYRPTALLPPIKNLDDNGHPQQVLLDLFGRKLPDGDPIVTLDFNKKGKVDFNALSLGPF